ncbi:MAG: phenylalanine--tRNA ligase subunit beta [Oscillospiraceae bacterium]|nr:phenylalanine--tRNA ligase subunit beta [Oscillospiraceae bacterium]
MDLSMKWLSDYVDIGDMTIKDYCSGLTLSGSKVERYDTEGSEISKVVVGKLLSVVPHENSDHLVICSVDVGAEAPIQIVTGAKNVKAGDIVPVALDGSTLPNGVKIKKGKLRGVESNGMLCSLGELGLTTHDFPYAIADGIFLIEQEEGCPELKLGMDIREAIGLNDTTVEFEITSNRPDCMSVLGLAKETAATFDLPMNYKKPVFKGVDGDIGSMLSVKISNTELCSRYCAGVVKNVKIGPSPRWMRERLRASGVRPINNFVDITNYVMLEYGHPMHAFDIRFIEGNSIDIRSAKNGEKITTLDGVERTLTDNMLVIADSRKPVAVAGVMGGEYSGIMDDTVDVVFEAACFDGASVRTTAKALGMRTDASSRFEKGLDPRMCEPALNRAFELVEELGCGEVVRTTIDVSNGADTQKSAPFDPVWINNFLGTELSEEEMISYLNKLDFTVKDGRAYAPAYRIDIECKADIAEEIARLYGYNNIGKTVIRGVAQASVAPEQKFRTKLLNASASLGFDEIVTYSFISPKNFDKIRLPESSPLRNTVTITNPLGEDTSVMRTTLLPSMLQVLSTNYNNRNESAKLFEAAREYLPCGRELPEEPERIVFGCYGADYDFYALKGAVEELFEVLGIEDVDYEPCTDDSVFGEFHAFHPGRCAIVTKDGKPLGIFGELHPKTAENYGINAKVYAAKLNVPEMMSEAISFKTYKPLPKFPAATRDLAVVVDDTVPAAHIEKAIKSAVGNILESVKLFDVYKGKQIAEGKKSVAYSIVMRSHDGTLTDEQADNAMKKVLKKLSELGAEIRS